MAVLENGFPFDNVEYDATALGAWLSTRTRGVFSSEDHYAVTLAGGMQVNVSSGIAWLKMNEQWGMVAPNPAAITLSVDVGDTILNRIDVACLRIDKNQSVQEVVIKKGELAATPVYPALVRDLNYDEIFLAAISVPAGTTELTAALLTDLRLNEEYCGLMRDGVTGIPTAQLQAQAEALIELLEDAIAGVIDGSQYMLKTQYAPNATAAVDAGVLVIASDNARVGTDYDLRFQVPDGYEVGMPLTVDGSAVTVKDSSNEDSELDAAPGAMVALMRNGVAVFPKTGGSRRVNCRVFGIAKPLNPKNGDIFVPSSILEKPFWTYGPEAPILSSEGDVFIQQKATSQYVIQLLEKPSINIAIDIPSYFNGTSFIPDENTEVYLNGVWNRFIVVAYDRGYENLEFLQTALQVSNWGSATATKAAGEITLTAQATTTTYYAAQLNFTSVLNLKPFSKLRITYSRNAGGALEIYDGIVNQTNVGTLLGRATAAAGANSVMTLNMLSNPSGRIGIRQFTAWDKYPTAGTSRIYKIEFLP